MAVLERICLRSNNTPNMIASGTRIRPGAVVWLSHSLTPMLTTGFLIESIT
jgi:hypothetical protein